MGHVDARAGVGGGAAGRWQVDYDRSRISHFSQVGFALFPLIRTHNSLFRLLGRHELAEWRAVARRRDPGLLGSCFGCFRGSTGSKCGVFFLLSNSRAAVAAALASMLGACRRAFLPQTRLGCTRRF